MHACVRTYIHTDIHVRVCIHTYMPTYIHAYMYTYIHTYIHAYIDKVSSLGIFEVNILHGMNDYGKIQLNVWYLTWKA